MFLPANWSSVLATAPVSCGAMTITLAPCACSACTLEASLVMSFCELLGGRALSFMLVTPELMYFAYEFQKSESDRGRSMPTFPAAAPLVPVLLSLPRLHPAAASATIAPTARTVAILRLLMFPRSGVLGRNLTAVFGLTLTARMGAVGDRACRRRRTAPFRWWRWPAGW